MRLIKQGLISGQNCKLFANKKSYSEHYAINEIEKYLIDCKYNTKGFKEISKLLYEKFIDNDDKYLIKLIKKILVIYKRHHQILLQKKLHKWYLNSLKLNNPEINFRNRRCNIEQSKPGFVCKKNLIKDYIKRKKSVKSNSNNNKNNTKNNKKERIKSASYINKNKAKPIINENKMNKNKTNKSKTIVNYEEYNNINFFNDNNKNNEKDIINNNNFSSISKINPKEKYNFQEIDNNLNNNIEDLISTNQIDNDKNNFYNNEINSNSNLGLDISRSKSVDKSQMIITKSKPWAYSYNRDNNSVDILNKIKKKKSNMNAEQRQELFNNLYNDGKLREEKYKKLSMEKENLFNSIYTFTPKIIPNKLNEKYLKNMTQNIKQENNNNYYNYDKMNTSSNYNNFINNNHHSNLYSNDLAIVPEEYKNDNLSLDFMSRLAEYEKIKNRNLQKIKDEVDITNKSVNIYKTRKIPIEKNHLINTTNNYYETKQKNIEKITQNVFEEQGITFKPKTNKNINDKIKNNIIQRNNEFLKDKEEKLQKYSGLKEKECTFQPQTNTKSYNTSKIGQQSTTTVKTDQNSSNVSKRLFDYQNKYKEKLEDIRDKYKKTYSFKPQISKNTDAILTNKKKMMEQMKEEQNINDGKQNEDDEKNNRLIMKQKKLGELEMISKRISELSEENFPNSDEKNSEIKQKKNNESAQKANLNNDYNYMNNEMSEENVGYNEENHNNYNYIGKKLLYGNNSIESNTFQIDPTKNNIKNSNYSLHKQNLDNINEDKIMELANNLLKEDMSKYTSKSQKKKGNISSQSERTNDFSSILFGNINNSKYSFNNYTPNNRIDPNFRQTNIVQEYDYDSIKGNKKIMNLNYYDKLL